MDDYDVKHSQIHQRTKATLIWIYKIGLINENNCFPKKDQKKNTKNLRE